VIYVVWRNELMHLFSKDPDVLRLGAMLMMFAAAYQLFDAMYVVYNGALRGAGDTFVPAVVLLGSCWVVLVLGGYVVARRRPEWGLVGPWTMASICGAIVGVFSLVRFSSGRWRAITLDRGQAITKLPAGVDAAPAPVAAATVEAN
jgi:multidrug resistance protein, MATE family